jgi:thioredoxin reductase
MPHKAVPADLAELPVVVIGAGPVGLAAAAHLLERGLRPVIFEAGTAPGAAIRAWGHIRLFSPWRFNIDAASRRLLERTGWEEPRLTSLPYGADLIERYVEPLAAVPAIRDALHTSSRVVAVSRADLDKTHSRRRDETPFLVRTQDSSGAVADHHARAVIDASGTWERPNPLGQGGLSAPGEAEAIATGYITEPLPDVTGRGRARFAGKHILVVGAGHSAANTLLNLGRLTRNQPGTRISWAVRGADVTRLYGGGDLDGLPARGQLGTRLRKLVEDGHIELHTSFTITGFKTADTLAVFGTTSDGDVQLDVDLLIPAAGFRPDLDILRELRLELDPAIEAPRQLGPLIDPEFHSCGTVPPHGAKLLAHPDKDFYLTGMKSYGRAPTFLLATGYEQVRSVVAAIAGDREAADTLQLELPETGVCSTDLAGSCDAPAAGTAADPEEAACCPDPEPAFLGIPTGLAHGRSGLPAR